MSQTKLAHVSGRDHYDAIYREQLANEAEWLDRTAKHKADSIEHLIRRNGIACETMLELGCGTGSVIRECHRRGLAGSYIAVDYSETAIDYLRTHSVGIETHIADVTDAELAFDRPVDVVILSHVIEHLEEPRGFLRSLQGIDFRYLIAEVPLDDLLMGRLSALLKKDRTENLAGHVQFFTARSFQKLLASSGLDVLDQRRYLPTLDMDTIQFVCRKNGSSQATYLKMVLGRYLRAALGPLWSTFFSAHYAVLAQVAPGSARV